MSTTTISPRISTTARAGQLVSVLLAVPMAFGSVMFSVVTPDHHYAAWVTWLFSSVAFMTALGLLVTAPRLATGPDMRKRLLRLLLVVQAYSLVKLSVFHEVESIPFLALAVAAFTMLRTGSARQTGHPRG